MQLINDMQVINGLSHTMSKAAAYLLASRTPQSHWGDIRSTSLAVWALNEVLAAGSPSSGKLLELRAELKDCQMWIAGQAKREEGGVSWESEAWDTSLAVIALTFDASFSEKTDQAVAWLERIRDERLGVWYDEVWETTLSTLALLRREAVRKGPRKTGTPWLEKTLHWLTDIPSKPGGEFVCPHYSGFLVWLLAEAERSLVMRELQTSTVFIDFKAKAAMATEYLFSKINDESDHLWSEHTFSNSYILYGLSALAQQASALAQPALVRNLPRIVRWFQNHQGENGGFEDVEDTSLAVLALSSIIRWCEIEPDLILDRISGLLVSKPSPSPKCFVGYSGASKSIARELTDILSHQLPFVEVKDWSWDFQVGRHLFAEIDASSRECQIAIFLLTKDDELIGATGEVPTPRDNIVFEVGFFSARIGMENTILIVEEGTKVPTDLGGILYLSIPDRTNLYPVTMALLDRIRRILGIRN
jgi:hypothetical protein